MSSEADVAESRPVSVEELAGLLRETASTAPVLRPRGGGTKSTWGAEGVAPDLVVDLTGLDRIVEHSPDDLVVTVEAGLPLTALQQQLAAHRQWLPLDPPERGATVGGVVAAAAAGPRRLRYGTPRDLLLGVTVVLADGTVARSGGKVVKNVAGYDLGKLFAGSFGTLGVVASATFRLVPQPPARRVVVVPADEPSAFARAVATTAVTPSAVEWDGGQLAVVIETTPAAADAMAEQLRRLHPSAVVTDRLPAAFGARPWRAGELALKVTHRLGALTPVLAATRAAFPSARLSAHVGSGVLWAGVPAAADVAAEVAAAVRALRTEIAPYDGSVVVVDAPAEVKRAVDVWGPVRGLAVMRRIKAQFDPDGRMNPGRFVGGL